MQIFPILYFYHKLVIVRPRASPCKYCNPYFVFQVWLHLCLVSVISYTFQLLFISRLRQAILLRETKLNETGLRSIWNQFNALLKQCYWNTHCLLCCCHCVNCGHQALEDLEVVVNHLGDGGQAVGGAASVGDNVHGGLQIFTMLHIWSLTFT